MKFLLLMFASFVALGTEPNKVLPAEVIENLDFFLNLELVENLEPALDQKESKNEIQPISPEVQHETK